MARVIDGRVLRNWESCGYDCFECPFSDCFWDSYRKRFTDKKPPAGDKGEGFLLRTIRKSAGLTQQQLAERLGITQKEISDAEVGKKKISWKKVLSLPETQDAWMRLDTRFDKEETEID